MKQQLIQASNVPLKLRPLSMILGHITSSENNYDDLKLLNYSIITEHVSSYLKNTDNNYKVPQVQDFKTR